MVKIMFEEGSGADYIINARMTVEMSFMGLEKVDKTTKGYGSFLIILIVQKARKGWVIIKAITIFVGPWLGILGGGHDEIKKITRGERRGKQILG